MRHLSVAARIITACIALADCSAPSLPVPPIFTTTTQPYSGLTQTIPFRQQSYVGTLTLPAASVAPQGNTLTLITSQTPFNAPPTAQDERRAAASTADDIPIVYFTLTLSATTIFYTGPSFSVNIPSNIHPSDGPFYLAFYDPTVTPLAWNYFFEGPAAVSGSMVSFAPQIVSPFTLKAAVHYYFYIYQQATSIASPSPSATPSPTSGPTATPTPPGSLSITANTLSLNGVGAGYAQTTTLQESGHVGAFHETDTCSSIATITQSSKAGPSSTITVTGLASGRCSATFRDDFNQSATLSVTVTVSGFHISLTTRSKDA